MEPHRTVCECGSTFKTSKHIKSTLRRHLASERHNILMNGGTKKIHDEIVGYRSNITEKRNTMDKLEEGTEKWNFLKEWMEEDQAKLQELEDKWLNA